MPRFKADRGSFLNARKHAHLYNNKRWRARRAEQLSREPLCKICKADGRVIPATVADHVVPHRGDERLFWCGELQSLCKFHHDSTKKRIELSGRIPGCDARGMPVDPNHHWREPVTYSEK